MAVVDTKGLTPEQRAAVLRDGSVGLSAGAGCGKTHVLTLRYLRHLEEEARRATGLDVAKAAAGALHSAVAITFTDRAAREMRDRLRRRLAELSRSEPERRGFWKAAYLGFEHARVGTFHSFCGGGLRTEAATLGLDPDFEQLDEAQAAALLREAVDDALRTRLGRPDSREQVETIDLLHRLGLHNLRSAATELAKVGDRAWATAPREVDSLIERWQERIEQFILRPLRETASDAARRLLPYFQRDDFHTKYWSEHGPRLKELLPKIIDGVVTSDEFAALPESTNAGGKHHDTKKEWNPEEYTAIRDGAKALRDAAKDWTKYAHSSTKVELRPHGERTAMLTRFVDDVRAEYARRKGERSALDFEDLLAQTRRLLVDDEYAGVRRRLARPIRLLLVDEFQDTNPIQAELVKALCESEIAAGKLFFVGDFKQSIYRFRGAEPRVFHDYRQELEAEGRLPLSLNFRSRPDVVRFANELFDGAFGDSVDTKLSAHREPSATNPIVEFMWPTTDRNANGEKPKADDYRRLEGRWIARRIRRMVDDGAVSVPDGAGGERPCRWGDVCILFRSLSAVRWYEQGLRELEIPYYLVGGKAFYSLQEVADVLNLLRAIQDPNDEIALFGALRSPLFAVDDASLYLLARHADGLAGGIRRPPPPQLSAEQRLRVESAQSILQELLYLKDRAPPAELLQTAFDRTGYDAVLLADFLGERQVANIEKLVDAARSFGPDSGFTLTDFIEQLSESVAEQPREAAAAMFPESADVVRLMTVHQAKGLEFPIVFVPDLSPRPAKSDVSPAAFDEAWGPVLRVSDDDAARVVSTAYRRSESIADRDELRRIFYVAVTRASEHLVLSAAYNVEKHLTAEAPLDPVDAGSERWIDLLVERFDLTTGKCRAPRETPPKVLVTTEEPACDRQESGDVRRHLRQALDTAEGATPATFPTLPTFPAVASIAVDAAARRTFSFSRLSGELRREMPLAEEDSSIRPREIAEAGDAEPLTLGLLVHAALAEFPWNGEPLRERLGRLAGDGDSPRTLQQAAQLLEAFASTTLADEIRQAKRRYAELEFLLRLPPSVAAEDAVDVHGFIDCLFQDASGQWRLVDFKTNRTTAEGVSAAAEPYWLQMYLYGEAARQAIGATPMLNLHFLRPNASLEVPPPAELAGACLPRLRRAVASARIAARES